MAAPLIDNRNRRSRTQANVLPWVTSLVGGLDTSLDAIKTAYGQGTHMEGELIVVGGNITLPYVALVNIPGGGGQVWSLEEDAVTVADGVFVVDPVDFNAVTNPRKWKRIL